MLIIAHRGAKGYVAENTLPAFQKAFALGAHGIELDVHLSTDGEVFVFHDEHTERLTGHIGSIGSMSSFEIRPLRVNGEFPIPLLADVFDLINNRLINVELKTASTAIPVVNLIERYVLEEGRDYGNFLVSSFDWTALQEIRKANPRIPLGVLTETDLDLAIAFAAFIEAESIHPFYHLLSAHKVADMQRNGFQVFAWTVNTEEDLLKIKSYNVDGIITDYPDRP
jgi:glycerophosphoryl diester phosphodiesterase